MQSVNALPSSQSQPFNARGIEEGHHRHPFRFGRTRSLTDQEIKDLNFVEEIKDGINKFLIEADKRKKIELNNNSYLSSFEEVQDSILNIFRYFDINLHNFLKMCSTFLSINQFASLESLSKSTVRGIKWFNPTVQSMFYCLSWRLVTRIRTNLDTLQKECCQLEKTINDVESDQKRSFRLSDTNEGRLLIQKVMEKREELFQAQQHFYALQNKRKMSFSAKIKKFTVKSLSHLVQIIEIPKKLGGKYFKNAFSAFEEIYRLREVNRVCQLQEEWTDQLVSARSVFIEVKESDPAKIREPILEPSFKPLMETLNNNWEIFLSSLRNCNSIQEVKQSLDSRKIEVDLPQLIEDWHVLIGNAKESVDDVKNLSVFLIHLKTLFIRSMDDSSLSVFRRAGLLLSSSDAKDLLGKRQSIFLEKVERQKNDIFTDMKDYLDDEVNIGVPFEKMKHDFFQSHQLDLKSAVKAYKKDAFRFANADQIFNVDWFQEIIKNANPQKKDDPWTIICTHLAKQRVDHYEEISTLTLQFLRQGLLSKNRVEKRFFTFHQVISGIKLGFSVIQMALTYPFSQLVLLVSIFDGLVYELTKLNIGGAGWITLFYPDLSLKIFDVAIFFVELSFDKYHRPNTCSLEVYKDKFLICCHEMMLNVYQLLIALEKLLLWARIKTIEKLTHRMYPEKASTKPFSIDPRLIEIEDKLANYRQNCTTSVNRLKQEIKAWKDLDMANLFGSLPARDPFDAFMDLLQKNSFDQTLLSEDLVQFLKENMGVNLLEFNFRDPKSNELLKQRLNERFSSKKVDFIQSYADARFENVIKTPSSVNHYQF